MPAENTVICCKSSGSGPMMSMPSTGFNSLICWKPSSASPWATISPTGVAGIFLRLVLHLRR